MRGLLLVPSGTLSREAGSFDAHRATAGISMSAAGGEAADSVALR